MFGNNANQMAHLVQKHQWDKVGKKLQGADVQTRIAIAAACGGSSDEEAPVTLINLLRDSDEAVQLQAVKSLGAVGSSSAKTHLQWLSDNLDGDKKELREAIQEAFSKISK
jgi:HEAT repeat protein